MSFCNIQKSILICYYNGWAIDSTALHLKEAKKLNHFVITYRITCKVNYCKIWKIGVGPGKWYQTKEREWWVNKSVLVKYWILFLIRYSFHRIYIEQNSHCSKNKLNNKISSSLYEHTSSNVYDYSRLHPCRSHMVSLFSVRFWMA